MTNQTLHLIASRRSHRAYKPAQISPEQLEALMTAALQSPSAMDRQPWHFSFVQDKDLLKRVTRAAHEQAALLEEAQRSPRFASPAFDLFYHAPTVVFISTPNGDSAVDCGIAAQTLALAAESLGLGSVIVGLARLAFESNEREALERALCFPEGNRFVISVAIGTPDDDKAPHTLNRGKITLIS